MNDVILRGKLAYARYKGIEKQAEGENTQKKADPNKYYPSYQEQATTLPGAGSEYSRSDQQLIQLGKGAKKNAAEWANNPEVQKKFSPEEIKATESTYLGDEAKKSSAIANAPSLLAMAQRSHTWADDVKAMPGLPNFLKQMDQRFSQGKESIEQILTSLEATYPQMVQWYRSKRPTGHLTQNQPQANPYQNQYNQQLGRNAYNQYYNQQAMG